MEITDSLCCTKQKARNKKIIIDQTNVRLRLKKHFRSESSQETTICSELHTPDVSVRQKKKQLLNFIRSLGVSDPAC